MSSKQQLSNLLRKYRAMNDLTQQQLADSVGVTRQSILSIEKGKYTPSVTLALQIAKVLQVSVEEIFQLTGGEENG